MKNVLSAGSAILMVPTGKLMADIIDPPNEKSILAKAAEDEKNLEKLIAKYGGELGNIKFKHTTNKTGEIYHGSI